MYHKEKEEIMKTFNFSPYNYWILYAAIVLLIIFLIITLMRALSLLKTIQAKQPELNAIQEHINSANQKVDSINRKIEQTKKKISPIVKALPILWAIQKIYEKTEDNGIKGYRTAATTYLTQQKNQTNFIKQVKKALQAGR